MAEHLLFQPGIIDRQSRRCLHTGNCSGNDTGIVATPDLNPGRFHGFQIHNGRHEGNCYVMACTFYQMAKVMGYSVRFMKGYVLTTSGRDSHGWVEIFYNGRWRIVDSLSSKGWMIWYGEKGTWRYTDYHIAYEEL